MPPTLSETPSTLSTRSWLDTPRTQHSTNNSNHQPRPMFPRPARNPIACWIKNLPESRVHCWYIIRSRIPCLIGAVSATQTISDLGHIFPGKVLSCRHYRWGVHDTVLLASFHTLHPSARDPSFLLDLHLLRATPFIVFWLPRYPSNVSNDWGPTANGQTFVLSQWLRMKSKILLFLRTQHIKPGPKWEKEEQLWIDAR